MGNVGKFFFSLPGLGGVGVDLTKSRPLETWTGPKDKEAPIYDAEAEKKQAEEASANAMKKKKLELTQTVNTSALGNTSKVTTGKTVLGG